MSPKIPACLWNVDEFSDLDDAGKVIFLWLYTGSGINNIGYVEVTKKGLLNGTCKGLEDLRRVLKTLPKSAFWGESDGVVHVWLRRFIKDQWSDGCLSSKSLVFKNLANHFLNLPEEFRLEIEASYKPLTSLFKTLHKQEDPYKGVEVPSRDKSRAEQSRALSPSSSSLSSLVLSSLSGSAEQPENASSDAHHSTPLDAHIPSREEFIAAFMSDGIPEEWLQVRFDYFDGNNSWLNKQGFLKKWATLVRGWWKDDRAGWKPRGAQTTGSNGHESAYSIKLRMDALEAEIQLAPANSLGTCPSADPTEEEKEDLKKKRAALRELRSRLSGT